MRFKIGLIMLALATLLSWSAKAVVASPPGNNGHVFVNGADLDGHEEPHVECRLDLEAIGFDPLQTISYTLSGQAPTGGGTFISGSMTTNANGYVKRQIDLTGVFGNLTPQPQQGFHVRLDVSTGEPGEQKHKVFWVQCLTPMPTKTPIPPTSTPTPAKTPVPPTPTNTVPVPTPTSTNTPPATATKMPVTPGQPTATSTPQATATKTPEHPGEESTPTPTATTPPSGGSTPTNTPQSGQPTPTNTPVSTLGPPPNIPSPTATSTRPATATNTPVRPSNTPTITSVPPTATQYPLPNQPPRAGGGGEEDVLAQRSTDWTGIILGLLLVSSLSTLVVYTTWQRRRAR